MFLRNFLYIMLSVTTAIGMAQCSSDSSSGGDSNGSDDVYLAQNIPSKFTVDAPKSVNSSASGSLSVKSGAKFDEGAGTGGDDCFSAPGGDDPEAISFGYEMIKSTVCQMQDKSKQVQFELMLFDAGYDQIVAYIDANGTDEVPAGEVKIKFTQPMRNFLVDQFGGFIPEDEIDLFVPSVGEELDNPALTYTRGENGDYDHTLTYEAFEVEDTAGIPDDPFGDDFTQEFSTSILWNNEKTKILIDQSGSFSGSFDDGFGGTETFSDTFSSKFSFNSETGVMKFSDSSDSEGFSFGFSTTMKECGADNCIELQITFENTFDDGFGGSDTFSEKSFGVADDFGGFVESTFEDDFGTTSYRETFDENGNLLSVCIDEGSGYSAFGSTGSDCDFGGNEYFDDVFAGGDDPVFDFGFIELTVSGSFGPYTGPYIIIAGNDPNDPAAIRGDGFNDTEAEFSFANYYGSDPSEIPSLNAYYEDGINETTFEPDWQPLSGVSFSQ